MPNESSNLIMAIEWVQRGKLVPTMITQVKLSMLETYKKVKGQSGMPVELLSMLKLVKVNFRRRMNIM